MLAFWQGDFWLILLGWKETGDESLLSSPVSFQPSNFQLSLKAWKLSLPRMSQKSRVKIIFLYFKGEKVGRF
jgi:hypothetical protein